MRLDHLDARHVVDAAEQVAELNNNQLLRPRRRCDPEPSETAVELVGVPADVADDRHGRHVTPPYARSVLFTVRLAGTKYKQGFISLEVSCRPGEPDVCRPKIDVPGEPQSAGRIDRAVQFVQGRADLPKRRGEPLERGDRLRPVVWWK
jgi:hypothetical protein